MNLFNIDKLINTSNMSKYELFSKLNDCLTENNIELRFIKDKLSFKWLDKKKEFEKNKQDLIRFFEQFLSKIINKNGKIKDLELQKNKKILFLIEYINEVDINEIIN